MDRTDGPAGAVVRGIHRRHRVGQARPGLPGSWLPALRPLRVGDRRQSRLLRHPVQRPGLHRLDRQLHRRRRLLAPGLAEPVRVQLGPPDRRRLRSRCPVTWAETRDGAFFFNARGGGNGTEVTQIWRSSDADDAANWPEAARVPEGDATADLYAPTLQGKLKASDQDVWFMSWEGDPAQLGGRQHPLGIAVESRGMAFSSAGKEDFVFFVYTFYNVTCTGCYGAARDAIRPTLDSLGLKFQQLNTAKFGVPEPTGGYSLDSLYVAFGADMDVTVEEAPSNFSSAGKEDFVFFVYTFYNVTCAQASCYAAARPTIQDTLLSLGQRFQALNNAKFGVTEPIGGYSLDSLFVAFGADMDVTVEESGSNYDGVNVPFSMGYTYLESFAAEPSWKFDPQIYHTPFFAGAGFVGVKYLKSPVLNGNGSGPDPVRRHHQRRPVQRPA